MFADHLRQSLARAPRDRLPQITALMYAALSAGQITDEEAASIEAAIQTRRLVPAVAPERRVRPPVVRCARRERQRRWAASGWLPPAVASRLTPARAAVLAVVAWQVGRAGQCRLCWAAVADLAGVCVTTVKAAIRDARALGIITTRERRHVGRRSESTIVTVIDRDVVRWIDRRGRAGGGGAEPPSYEYKEKKEKEAGGVHRLPGRSWRFESRRDGLSAGEPGSTREVDR